MAFLLSFILGSLVFLAYQVYVAHETMLLTRMDAKHQSEATDLLLVAVTRALVKQNAILKEMNETLDVIVKGLSD
jgi:hypothetical protein